MKTAQHNSVRLGVLLGMCLLAGCIGSTPEALPAPYRPEDVPFEMPTVPRKPTIEQQTPDIPTTDQPTPESPNPSIPIEGYSSDFEGVLGSTVNGTGVSGYASGNGYGVFGDSEWGNGVVGVARAYGYGVLGMSESEGVGVRGEGGAGVGVWATSEEMMGVYGESGNSYGGFFVSQNDRKADVVLSGSKGVLSSDPDQGDSHLVLTANGNIDLIPDWNEDGLGMFTVRQSPGGAFNFSVANDGTVYAGNVYSLELETPKLQAQDITATNLDASKISTKVIEITGGIDVSELFEVHEIAGIEPVPGMVVSIDPVHPGDVTLSYQAYDPKVVGVIAGAGNISPGIIMGDTSPETMELIPVGVAGRVYCWADTSNGPIEPGDLLTASYTPGYAMKVTDYSMAQGATIGKAMTRLDYGKGLVLVLIMH